MKKLTKISILSFLLVSISSYATTESNPLLKSDITSIELNDGGVIFGHKRIAIVQFALDRPNKVDFVELQEGTVIDSYDIKSVNLSREMQNAWLLRNIIIDDSGQVAVPVRNIGDGSGG